MENLIQTALRGGFTFWRVGTFVDLSELRIDALSKIAEDSPSNAFDDDTLTRWINEAQRVFVRQTKVLQAKTTFSTVANTQAYDLASDVWLPRLCKYDTWVIYPMGIDAIESQNTAKGTPSNYAVWNNQLILWPTPTAVATVLMYYFKRPTTLVDDADTPEIPEEFHGSLTEYTASQARSADEQGSAANNRMIAFQNAVEECKVAYSERQDQDSRVRDVYGIGVDPWWP